MTLRLPGRAEVRSDQALHGRVVVALTVESPLVRVAARAAGREGAVVVVAFTSNLTAAQDIINEIRSSGGSAIMLPADPTVVESNWAMYEKILAQLGGIDVVLTDVSVLRSSRYQPGVRGEWTPVAPTEAALDLAARMRQGDCPEALQRFVWLGTEENEALLGEVVQRLAAFARDYGTTPSMTHSVVRGDHDGFTVETTQGDRVDFTDWIISTMTSDMTPHDESCA